MSGHFSGWQAYTGAALGGAVGGWSSEYIGPVLGAASGRAAANATTQGLNIASGNQHGFSGRQLATQTFIGAVASKIPGIPVGRLNQGRNSYRAIAKQIQTKLQNSTVSGISSKTAAKAVVGRAAGESGSMAAEAAMSAGARAVDANANRSAGSIENTSNHTTFSVGVDPTTGKVNTPLFINGIPQAASPSEEARGVPPLQNH